MVFLLQEYYFNMLDGNGEMDYKDSFKMTIVIAKI